MENIKISVSESSQDEATSVIRVDGVIDTLTATQLEEVLDRLLKRSRYEIILDLAGVDYISSAGWGIFISRIKEIRQNKGDIKLASMVPNVYEIYELLEFDNILSAYGNVNEARTAFGTGNPAATPKKKAADLRTMTTIEELPFRAEPSSDTDGISRLSRDRDDRGSVSPRGLVLKAIRHDPFYTISELKMVLAEKMDNESPGWWGIFKILWKNKLLSRRSRFRYARQYRSR